MSDNHIERDLETIMLQIINSEFYPLRGMTLKRFLECVSHLYPVEDGAIDKAIADFGYAPDDIVRRNFNRE